MSNSTKGRSGGVLPVNAATRKNATPHSGSKSASRAPALRLRLVIRRLPPGLTESEFWAALGDEWKVGAGKVEWAAFKSGKISKDLAKPSRPSRAYIKVREQSLLDVLSAAVRGASFQDAKNTSKDPCLLGPPSLEFAPYNKIPSGRARNDGRQGTIDQDQEFIDFLQSLTQPITKSTTSVLEPGEAKPEKIAITPLVQYIKEKKANKAKETAQAKTAKSRETKEVKPAKSETRPTIVVKGKNSSIAETEKEKVEEKEKEREKEKEKAKDRGAKATQEPVKPIAKPVSRAPAKQTAAKPEAKRGAKELASQPAPAPAATSSPGMAQEQAPARRERERGNVSAAARMLQRDLGLVAKENKSQRTARGAPTSTTPTNTTEPAASASTKGAATVSASNKAEPSIEPPKQGTSTPSPPASNTTTTPTGPRASRTPSTASSKAAAAAAATPAQSQRPTTSKTGPQPSAGAKSAFLKHANPSQGITEDTLRSVFADFGTITRCEIDKKKGLGYIDFSEADGLKKAMAASPVKVANGQVVVLENRPQHGKRGGQAKSTANTSIQSPQASAPPSATGTKTTKPSSSKTTAVPTAPASGSASTPAQTATPSLAEPKNPEQVSTNSTPTTAATPTTTAAAGTTTPATAPRGRGGGGGGRSGRNNPRGSGQGAKQGQGQQRGGRGGGRRGGGGGGGGASGAAPSSASPSTAATPAAGGNTNANANGTAGGNAASTSKPTPAAGPAKAELR
ncbi:hypothetical protein ABEF95_014711 [Exophiala dermatitidis]